MAAPEIGRRARWVGGVPHINFNHPLAARLLSCVIPRDDYFIDLVTGVRLGPSTGTPTVGVNQFGATITSNGTAVGGFFSRAFDPPAYPLSFTWAGSSAGGTQQSGSGLFCYTKTAPGVAENPPYLLGFDINSSRQVRLEVPNGTSYVGGNQLTTTSALSAVPAVVTGTATSGATALYFNGVSEATGSPSVSNANFGGASSLCVAIYSNNALSVSVNTNIAMVHGRVLSRAEISQLAFDPFQMLRY